MSYPVLKSHQTKKRRVTSKKEKTRMFHTHDNGAYAYNVLVRELVHGNRVEIENAQTTKLIKSYNAMNIHYGVSKGSSSTKGNSILLHLSGNKYVYIGDKVYEFQMEDEVDKYFSLIGNGDVPYPVLLGTENVYFMLDKTYVPRSEFEIKMTPKMWEDGYAYYYGYLDAKTGEKHGGMEANAHGLENKAKKMKGFRMVNRR